MPHLPYSASATDRWLACPASVAASKELPQRADEPRYTTDGTLAHGAAETALRSFVDDVTEFSDDESLVDAAQMYVDEVNAVRNAYTVKAEWIEVLFGHAEFPDFGGSPDYVAFYDHDGLRYLHVVDFKSGIGLPVDVDDNSQLLSYCAVIASQLPVHVDRFRMTVVQPRAFNHDSVQTTEVGHTEIEAHMAKVIKAMNEHHYSAGSHCRWCPVATRCETLRRYMLACAELETEGVVPDNATLANWLELFGLATTIRAVLDDIGRQLVTVAQAGKDLPGYKVVESRSNRFWAAEEGEIVAAMRKLGVAKKELFVAPKLKSPSQIESLKLDHVTKKDIKLAIQPAIGQKVTGLRVVPEKSPGNPVQFGTEFSSLG